MSDASERLGWAEPATTRDEYFQRWSQLHGGVDPNASRLTRWWLTFAYVVARPITAMGVSPNGMTLIGAFVALLVPLLGWLSSRQAAPTAGAWVPLTDGAATTGGSLWLWLAVLACAVSGLADNLDGAVAVISGRTTKWGYVLDSVVDRLSDAALLVALWAIGAPAAVCVAAGFLTVLQEYSRARAGAAGMSEVGVVSIWERPTRVIVTAVFIALAAIAPYGLTAADWASIGAYAALGLSVFGLTQVTWAIRAALRSMERPRSSSQ